MTDKQIIRALLGMLREAHHEIQVEINAAADDDHPMMAAKIKMLKRHEQRLARLRLRATDASPLRGLPD